MKVDIKANLIQQIINADSVSVENNKVTEQERSVDGSQVSEELIIIQEVLRSRFNFEEIKMLCFRMGIVFEDIGGDTLQGKIRELLLFLERRKQISKLLQEIKQERPDIDTNMWCH